MTPIERLEYQRRNRRVLYGIFGVVVVVVSVLGKFHGSL